LDILSQPAREVLRLSPQSAYMSLVPLAEGAAEARTLLASLKPESVLSQFVANRDAGAAMIAGLWLWHDFLGESHAISQGLEDPTGSFWHAIMHRREGDFSNSKYWIHRVGQHPVYKELAVKADDAIRPFPADKSIFKLTNDGWNASAFVDLVQQVHQAPSDPRHALAVTLQQLEWRLLFDHCTRVAAGGTR
jgi:hypothetical protein